ncbi:NADPH:quinone reductase-like Zn-dependent oxidoreductase [Actinomadura pelletieri DSM 43383]|uniref:NADPH:quinone reductase-like Zn-dependent oxidoreductase n=1 Tax=Actinomadura pelletieri DSM 43383 TaxID=1120940 RepID=A0A495QJ23_9ACTN|nr:NADP-dependent oxidoreductase [Actinomadura pelletieri]RKS72056.1 NADPH:quinone reductase-like Zn-dependent oxidoreductase [Actinomadura pelletieri DSM 43383]
MRAIAVSEYGATPAPMYLPRPVPGPGEILVKVIAAGLNPLDWKLADGMLKDTVDASFPLILGQDGAGVVDEVGAGVTRLRHGEQVYGIFAAPDRGLGAFAEYAVVREDGPVARIPDGMIYTEAAAVPTVGSAALAMLEQARVEAGQTVLVVGATGGVGQCLVQLASLAGVKVIATARADMAGTMRRLGADETVDYSHADRPLSELNAKVLAVHDDGIDAVLDLVGDTSTTENLARLLRPGGTYLSAVWAVHPDSMEAKGLRAVNLDDRPSAAALERLSDLIDAGDLRVRVEREIPLEETPDALAVNRVGGARGKTVIRV